MEVIPTDETGDDGVIWLRCPECQGFLPKFSGAGLSAELKRVPAPPPPETKAADDRGFGPQDGTDDSGHEAAAQARAAGDEADLSTEALEAERPDGKVPAKKADSAPPAEPIAEYAASLAAADLTRTRSYRPTDSYVVGEVIHHLAHGDIGIVVAKERLPGGRQAVKVFFEQAGVVHLIEQAPAEGR